MQSIISYIRPTTSVPFWVASDECKQLMASINIGDRYIKSIEKKLSPDRLVLDVIITYNSEADFNARTTEFNQKCPDFGIMRNIYNITHQHDIKIVHYTNSNHPVVVMDTILGIYNYETKN